MKWLKNYSAVKAGIEVLFESHMVQKRSFQNKSGRNIRSWNRIIKNIKSGEYRFCLKAKNGEVIAVSEGYTMWANCENAMVSVKKNAPIAAVEDQTVEGYATEKHPKFEIYKDKAGEFRFRLKARNGEPILASEGYTAKASCLNGVESVKKNAESEIAE